MGGPVPEIGASGDRVMGGVFLWGKILLQANELMAIKLPVRTSSLSNLLNLFGHI